MINQPKKDNYNQHKVDKILQEFYTKNKYY